MFHVKDKMKREDIMKAGLVKILDSLDGQDESLTNERLLHHLWLWPSKPFDDVFGPFLPQCGKSSELFQLTTDGTQCIASPLWCSCLLRCCAKTMEQSSAQYA